MYHNVIIPKVERHINYLSLLFQGFGGLYRGYFSTVIREIPFAFIQFPTWEYLKVCTLMVFLCPPSKKSQYFVLLMLVCRSVDHYGFRWTPFITKSSYFTCRLVMTSGWPLLIFRSKVTVTLNVKMVSTWFLENY